VRVDGAWQLAGHIRRVDGAPQLVGLPVADSALTRLRACSDFSQVPLPRVFNAIGRRGRGAVVILHPNTRATSQACPS
jgi:hypothetical protein